MSHRGNKKVFSLYQNWLEVPLSNEPEERLMMMPKPFDDDTLRRSDYNPLYYSDNFTRVYDTGNPWTYHYGKVATQAVYPLNCYRAEAPAYYPSFQSCPATGEIEPPSGKFCFNDKMRFLLRTQDCSNGHKFYQVKEFEWADPAFTGSSTAVTAVLPVGPRLQEGEGFCDSYFVTLEKKCDRVLVYDKITHDGTTYDTGRLMEPDFVLRPRNYKEWPRYVSGAWTTGEAWQTQGPTGVLGLQPFSYYGDNGVMKYTDHFIATMNGQNLTSPPNWNLVDYSGMAEVGDLDKIDGQRVLDLLSLKKQKWNGSAFQTMTTTSFIDEVPTGVQHQLVLETENWQYVTWRFYRKEKLYPPGHPDEGELDWYNYKALIVEKGFYNTFGTAYALY